MWRPGPIRRDRLAILLALAAVVGLGSAFVVAKNATFLMPGPLTSAHGAIEKCSACHSKNGSGKLSWIRGLFAGDPLADSKACLTCHNMPDTAFNAHGASAAALRQSTERLARTAAQTPLPASARAQSIAFPTHDMIARGLYCATCHQEHQGADFKLSRISNEQCRSCHAVKFDSFDGHHPQFENYPFKRRTRIVYDHAGHFGKHYPELAKKEPGRRIPETCSSCHNSREDRRVMAVAPFEQTCSGCHLNQIIGKERVSGPQGIAFLTLPGLDLQTLRKKNASIGEWPDASEAGLAPFMRVMISRNERGRALIKAVDGLNLQDLSNASADQIAAVTDLVWEIKALFYAMIKGKASDVLGDLNIGGGAKLSPNLVADLTASIPRDVVISAQQQWLPNLAAEMPNRPALRERDTGGWNTVTTESRSAAERPGSRARQAITGPDPRGTALDRNPEPTVGRVPGPGGPPGRALGGGAARPGGAFGRGGGRAVGPSRVGGPRLPPAMRAGVMDAGKDAASTSAENGEQRLAADETGGPITGRWSLPSGTPRALEAREKDAELPGQPEDAAEGTKAESSKKPPADARPPESKPEGASTAPNPEGAKDARSANEQPQGKPTEQTDDLLFPTQEELRAIEAGPAKSGRPEGTAATADTSNAAASADAASGPDATAPADTNSSPAAPLTRAAPVISIESDVDPESWAEYGGWYRQDYAIYYRPTGHKDKLIYSWLYLTGPQARKGDTSPAAAVFDYLTGKDAQGSCTKCHSVDDIPGKGRRVNFSPPSPASKQGRFTTFIHEPHMGIMENRGCLTCHSLEKGRPYLKSYEQGDPHNFASNFGAVKKDLCQSCHTSRMARQDCLLCHKYHVNGVITPIISTKIPVQ